MDFFSNQNIAYTIVEQVPCAFAKSPDGVTHGTHYTVLMLDKDKNVLYMSCQCEEEHGADIASTMEEMGGQTCFALRDKMRGYLSGRLEVPDPYYRRRSEENESVLTSQVNVVARRVDKIRKKRSKCQPVDVNIVLGKAAARRLEHIANGISRTQMFRVNFDPVGETGRPFFTLTFGNRILATRGISAQQWDLTAQFGTENTDRPIQDRHYLCESLWQMQSPTRYHSEWCAVCQKLFERMSKHVQGHAHRVAVQTAVETGLKFTAGEGLRAVNKHGLETYRKLPGRNTKKKRNTEATRIANLWYLDKNLKWLDMYRSPLGLKEQAVRGYADDSGFSDADCRVILQRAANNNLGY